MIMADMLGWKLIYSELTLEMFSQNEDKTVFYKGHLDKLLDIRYENWYLLGDWNGVISPQFHNTFL